MVFGDLNSDFATFFCNDIGLNSITLYNINFDDDNFVALIQKLLAISDLWLGIIDLNNVKHVKKYR